MNKLQKYGFIILMCLVYPGIGQADCKQKTAIAVYNCKQKGLPVRIGHGWYMQDVNKKSKAYDPRTGGTKHRWCERLVGGEWLVYDKAIDNVGKSWYPLSAFKTYGKPDYKVRYYEYVR